MSELNIHQKLIEVRKVVEFLKKEHDSDRNRFKYVSSSQAILAVRAKMDELNLLLITKVTGHKVTPHTTKGGANWYFTEIDFEYTWVNADKPEETIVIPWYGQGLDESEKGVGKACTYSEKYFILKQFNIPTDKDDPDASPSPPSGAGKKEQTRKKGWDEYETEMTSQDTAAALSDWWTRANVQMKADLGNKKYEEMKAKVAERGKKLTQDEAANPPQSKDDDVPF